jgi:hypothetical protein
VEGPAVLVQAGAAPQLELTGAGAVVVRARQDGNDDYEPAPEVAQPFVVNGRDLVLRTLSRSLTSGFRVNLLGTPGPLYVIEAKASADPAQAWLPLRTNDLAAGGQWDFTDPGTSSFQHRVYRARTLP